MRTVAAVSPNSRKTIHQFVAGFSSGDAITNESLVLRDIFRSWGYQSNIFSESKRILPELRKQIRDVSEYADMSRPQDVVLLHLSIGSPVNNVFSSLSCKKAILYHNVTPSHYFEFINNNTARNLARGRKQMKSLANLAAVNMADSTFNADELKAAGYRDVKVLSLILDLGKLRSQPDKATLKRFDDDTVNVLFVGRCAPNKKIEDAINAFYCFHKFVEPKSRFIHVGSFSGTESYYSILIAQTHELGIKCVHFAGSVPQAQLNAFYKCADIFLCMSEHEGFCIPVIESMACDIPVIAYAAAAVPETMDGAGILFREKKHKMIAEIMGRIVNDRHFRNSIIKGQQERLLRYTQHNTEHELEQCLKPILE